MIDQYGRWYPDFPGQQPYMDPQFARIQGPQHNAQTMQQPAQQQQQQVIQPMMTPPTIHAEIVQVDSEQAASQFPVGAGSSQMMIARDETAIFVKTATANGYTLDVFQKRPPSPESAPFNPADYVRLDALPALISAEVQAAVSEALQLSKSALTKKETEETE